MSRRRRAEPESVFTAHSVGDVLAAVPILFGFVPEESFIAVATSGPRNRFGFRLRIDLPELDDVDVAADLALHHLRRQGAEGAMLIALSSDHERAEAMVRAAYERLEPDIEPIVVVWADGHRYWQPLPRFPRHGVRYQASRHDLAIVQAVAAGQEILADRGELVRRFAPCDGDVADRMVEAYAVHLDRVLRLFGQNPTDASLVSAATAEIDPVLDRALRDQQRLSDEEVALVSLWCTSVMVRDELWARIDLDNAEDWLRVLTDLSGRVLGPPVPSVLCLAGFAAYMVGDGAQAVIALERALEADPAHRMSGLLMQLVQGGVSPEQYVAFGQLTIAEAMELESQRERSA
ncbi:DUF4192 domain-containing protein [Aeromicrobium sp. Leaf350]|uniref:DUF4192 domain-containing protein n=1 Tax=Aeromicrobium sp. Leaf350 TaxID=2876565 RepID=UPI001E2CC46E|nr:DUF4192 domain-containing protein [Aeromicrobium sp. Leaf350]